MSQEKLSEVGVYRLSIFPSILEEPTLNYIDLAQILKTQAERFEGDLKRSGRYESAVIGSHSFAIIPSYVARFVQGFIEQGGVPQIDEEDHIERNHSEDLNTFYRFVIALPGLHALPGLQEPPGNHRSASRWPWAMRTAAQWMIANRQQKQSDSPPVTLEIAAAVLRKHKGTVSRDRTLKGPNGGLDPAKIVHQIYKQNTKVEMEKQRDAHAQSALAQPVNETWKCKACNWRGRFQQNEKCPDCSQEIEIVPPKRHK